MAKFARARTRTSSAFRKAGIGKGQSKFIQRAVVTARQSGATRKQAVKAAVALRTAVQAARAGGASKAAARKSAMSGFNAKHPRSPDGKFRRK